MIIADAKQLGAALRARRRELHVTQQQAAEMIDVNRRVVGELERGKSTVRLQIVLELAKALGLDVDLRTR